MIMVYFRKRKNQRTVNYESMTKIEFNEFQKAIEDKKINVIIVGIQIS